MTAVLRLVDTGLAAARWNVAVTAALAELRRRPGARDVLRFHRYRPAVLIGRGQAHAEAIDVAACRHHGVEVARRVSGGGAIVVGPSVLAFDLVVAGGVRDLGARVATAIAAALQTLGAASAAATAQAVLVDGAKICGLSGGFDGPVSALQASLVLEDIGGAVAALLAPQIRMTPGPAMTDLAAVLGRVPDLAIVQAALGRAVAQALAREALPDRLAAAEADLADRLLAEDIGTEAFVRGEACEPVVTGAAS